SPPSTLGANRMRRHVHSEEPLHTDRLIDLRVAGVELPDGRHLDHRLIRTSPSAGAVVTDGRGRVLLIWRHRFITDTWGREIPMGKIDPGEKPSEAAARAREEETARRPGPPRRGRPASAGPAWRSSRSGWSARRAPARAAARTPRRPGRRRARARG